MKNRKFVIVFGLIILLLLAVMPYVKATGNELLIITNNEEYHQNQENEENIENQENQFENNQLNNEEQNVENNEQNTNTNNTQANNEQGMPQTGVAEDTTLFVFIVICIASAIYAYIKIRNYKNV